MLIKSQAPKYRARVQKYANNKNRKKNCSQSAMPGDHCSVVCVLSPSRLPVPACSSHLAVIVYSSVTFLITLSRCHFQLLVSFRSIATFSTHKLYFFGCIWQIMSSACKTCDAEIFRVLFCWIFFCVENFQFTSCSRINLHVKNDWRARKMRKKTDINV